MSDNVKYVFAWAAMNESYDVETSIRLASEDMDVVLNQEEHLFLVQKISEYRKNRPKDDEDFESRFGFFLLAA